MERIFWEEGIQLKMVIFNPNYDHEIPLFHSSFVLFCTDLRAGLYDDSSDI